MLESVKGIFTAIGKAPPANMIPSQGIRGSMFSPARPRKSAQVWMRGNIGTNQVSRPRPPLGPSPHFLCVTTFNLHSELSKLSVISLIPSSRRRKRGVVRLARLYKAHSYHVGELGSKPQQADSVPHPMLPLCQPQWEAGCGQASPVQLTTFCAR